MSVFTIIMIAIGIGIAAVAASTHGVASTPYTTLLIGFGLFIVLGFAIAGFIMNGRSGKVREELR